MSTTTTKRARKPTFASTRRAAEAIAKQGGHKLGGWDFTGPYQIEGVVGLSSGYARAECRLCKMGVSVHDEPGAEPQGPAVRRGCAEIRREQFLGAAETLRRRAQDFLQSATDVAQHVDDVVWLRSTLAHLERGHGYLRGAIDDARARADALDGV